MSAQSALLYLLGCTSLEEKRDTGTTQTDISPDVFTEDCEVTDTPAQLRLLTSHEYNSSIYDLFYEQGDSSTKEEECATEESCLYGVCRPSPCNQHTFVWPHNGSDVWIAGTFNEWIPQPMSKRNNSWVQTFSLEPGAWVYKFVVDGEWRHN